MLHLRNSLAPCRVTTSMIRVSPKSARLAGIESLWDPGSRRLLDELGIGAGWRCLEVGAGGGSLAEWMAGRGATVTAIDIDTRFLEQLAGDTVEVRRVD